MVFTSNPHLNSEYWDEKSKFRPFFYLKISSLLSVFRFLSQNFDFRPQKFNLIIQNIYVYLKNSTFISKFQLYCLRFWLFMLFFHLVRFGDSLSWKTQSASPLFCLKFFTYDLKSSTWLSKMLTLFCKYWTFYQKTLDFVSQHFDLIWTQTKESQQSKFFMAIFCNLQKWASTRNTCLSVLDSAAVPCTLTSYHQGSAAAQTDSGAWGAEEESSSVYGNDSSRFLWFFYAVLSFRYLDFLLSFIVRNLKNKNI